MNRKEKLNLITDINLGKRKKNKDREVGENQVLTIEVKKKRRRREIQSVIEIDRGRRSNPWPNH